MDKRIHFVSGLPRSGPTPCGVLLRQNIDRVRNNVSAFDPRIRNPGLPELRPRGNAHDR
ncbi:hypothetical protein LMG28138_05237 [Pararobbsia alpina]|uniref:Sulfotransferase family protein n=1 Tax=Pararobbsia alpina TaxID=621374 RepID=A0A6S7BY59_9BURK|nr:hypothetical protein LMG28138_05237 [Pararobbsia alpina]